MRLFDYFLLAIAAVAVYGPTANPDTSEKLLQQAGPAILKLTAPFNHETGGTGFLLRERRGFVIVTNGHVCEIASGGEMLAWNADGSNFLVQIRKVSETTDLCLLDPVRAEMTAIKGKPLELAQYQHRAEQLWVIGHPYLDENTVASGYIVEFSQLKVMENVPEAECKGPHRQWMELFCVRLVYAYSTSIVIYPGNSGSPVMTRDGEVVGVMFAGSRDTHFGSFIPLSDLVDFLAGN